jgi:hypothetical protein
MKKKEALAKQAFWNHSLKLKIKNGFSEEELLYLVDEREGPLANMTHDIAEMHSYGKCNRERINIPKFFPFPFYGDHGVNYESRIFDFERQNSARYYIAYNERRARLIRNHLNKKIIIASNPYVFYVKKNNIHLSNDASGVLAFYAHSVTGFELDYNLDKYLSELEQISDKCGKLVICMHMHDVRKGYYKPLLNAGIPVVTAGYTSSYYFADRFFDIIRGFEYATSNFGGSELFYTTYIGVKYFIYGEYPKFINHSNANFEKEGALFDKDFFEFDEKKLELFHIDDLGVESGISTGKMKLIYFQELFYYIFFVRKLMLSELMNFIFSKLPKQVINFFASIYKNSFIRARDSIRYRLGR